MSKIADKKQQKYYKVIKKYQLTYYIHRNDVMEKTT